MKNYSVIILESCLLLLPVKIEAAQTTLLLIKNNASKTLFNIILIIGQNDIEFYI